MSKNCQRWDITIYKFSTENIELVDHQKIGFALIELCNKLAFQLEETKEKHQHYQIRCNTIKPTVKNKIIKFLFEKLNLNSETEKQIIQSVKPTAEATKNFNYVMKEESRINGPWTDSDFDQYKEKEKYIPSHVKGFNADRMPWHDELIKIYEEFDKMRKQKDKIIKDKDFRIKYYQMARCCNIILDFEGGKGKTTISSIIKHYYNGIILPIINDCKELTQAICNELKDNNIREPGPILLDLPRSMEKKLLKGIYGGLENVMTCSVKDTRHHLASWDFECPQIWVFTNELPDVYNLSLDRWRFYTITKDNHLKLIDLREAIKLHLLNEKAKKNNKEWNIKLLFEEVEQEIENEENGPKFIETDKGTKIRILESEDEEDIKPKKTIKKVSKK